MKTRKSTEPNTDRCGTPLHTGLHLEYLHLDLIHCCQSVSHAFSYSVANWTIYSKDLQLQNQTFMGLGPPCNTPFLEPPRIHVSNAISPEPTVFSWLTLDYLYSLLWDGPFSTQKLPLPVGRRGYWGPPHPTRQTASRSVPPFSMIPRRYMTSRQTHSQTDHATRQKQ